MSKIMGFSFVWKKIT